MLCSVLQIVNANVILLNGTDINLFEVRQLIGEYDFVAKQLYQAEDPQTLLMDIAREYQENEDLMKGVDGMYGDRSARYIGEAIKVFSILERLGSLEIKGFPGRVRIWMRKNARTSWRSLIISWLLLRKIS